MNVAERPLPPGSPGDAARPTGIPLGQLIQELRAADLIDPVASVPPHTMVAGVRQDSRRLEPGELFVALRGEHADGAHYISAAAERGAVAVLLDRQRSVDTQGLCRLESSHPRRAMALAAALVYGRPTEQLEVIGITGTNGKTTTAHLVQHCLAALGKRCGLVGTLTYQFEDWAKTATHTSPESDELFRILRTMVQRGATHLVMEVSSIALAAERVAAVRFALAAFTNLTQDHLDYHGSMAAYARAKDQLFFDFAPPVVVLNIDDPHGAQLASQLAGCAAGRILRVSAAPNVGAEVYATDVQLGQAGIQFGVVTPSGAHELRAPLVGAHNVANLLCTIAIIEGLGLELAPALVALHQAPQVGGRLERCDRPGQDDVVAIVDYAHTPDALARVLHSVRPLTAGRLWCVFGCGGDRDAAKRGPMGEAVGSIADHAIVTNDNPRSEDPQHIADAVVAGLEQQNASYEVELDRAVAIDQAITRAAPGDVVLVAGKGHEPYQIIGSVTTAFDDRVVLGEALARRRQRREE